MKIDHIGIAVRSLADSIKVYEEAIGLAVSGYDQVDDQGVRVAMLNVGELGPPGITVPFLRQRYVSGLVP